VEIADICLDSFIFKVYGQLRKFQQIQLQIQLGRPNHQPVTQSILYRFVNALPPFVPFLYFATLKAALVY
jgi:hypothetical protein